MASSGEDRQDGEGDADGDAGPHAAAAGARDEEGEDEDAGEAADTGSSHVERAELLACDSSSAPATQAAPQKNTRALPRERRVRSVASGRHGR